VFTKEVCVFKGGYVFTKEGMCQQTNMHTNMHVCMYKEGMCLQRGVCVYKGGYASAYKHACMYVYGGYVCIRRVCVYIVKMVGGLIITQ
jgi:hypothetical protein